MISATEARNNIGNLWKEAAKGPVTVCSAGQEIAVVLSPTEFARLSARHQGGAKAGFAKHLFTNTDMNALLETNIDDVFAEYSC